MKTYFSWKTDGSTFYISFENDLKDKVLHKDNVNNQMFYKNKGKRVYLTTAQETQFEEATKESLSPAAPLHQLMR